MSTLFLSGLLIDTTGVLQGATTGSIAAVASCAGLPVDSSGNVLCVEEASQARFWVNGLARATSSGYLIFDGSGAIATSLGGWPLTSSGALAVDLSGGASGNFRAGVGFTTGGRIRATGLS